jgi:para-nitrobenzyl esterase
VRYDADLLASENVVMVSVTFRLSGFGYLTPNGKGDSNVGVRTRLPRYGGCR